MLDTIFEVIYGIIGKKNLIPFKCGSEHLVSAYDEKRKLIKHGNPYFHDGTRYQKTYRKENAIKFIDGMISDVTHHENEIIRIEKYYHPSTYSKKEIRDLIISQKLRIMVILNDYETIEKYKEIKQKLL